jgi:hypothetical protein
MNRPSPASERRWTLTADCRVVRKDRDGAARSFCLRWAESSPLARRTAPSVRAQSDRPYELGRGARRSVRRRRRMADARVIVAGSRR